MNLTTTLLATKAGGTQGIISMVVIYAAIIAIFWFFAIRPQKKQKAKTDQMLSQMEPGDNIMTTSGFYGTILDVVDDSTIIVEFGNNKNCRIPMHKSAVAELEKQGSSTVTDDDKDKKSKI